MNTEEIMEWYESIVCDLSPDDIEVIDQLLKEHTENKQIRSYKDRATKAENEVKILKTENISLVKRYNNLVKDSNLKVSPKVLNKWDIIKKEYTEQFMDIYNFIKIKQPSKQRLAYISQATAIVSFWSIPTVIVSVLVYVFFGTWSVGIVLGSVLAIVSLVFIGYSIFCSL